MSRDAASGVKRLPEIVESEVKRQRVANATMTWEMDLLLGQFASMREALASGDTSCSDALRELREQCAKTEETTLHLARTKTSQVTDASESAAECFSPIQLYHEADSEGALWADRKDPIADLIGQHLHASGALRSAEAFEAETGVAIDAATKQRYAPLHALLLLVEQRDLPALLREASAMRQTSEASPVPYAGPGFVRMEGQIDRLEFLLHRLAAHRLLQAGQRGAALQYIREHLSCRHGVPEEWAEVMRLVGRLAFIREGEPASEAKVHPRYGGAQDDAELWGEVGRGVAEAWCALTQTPKHPHLVVALAAGYEGMPTLRKYLSLPSLFRKTRELHVPALPHGMLFHSSVSCPVTHQVTTDGDGANPAMLLPCCHVISRAAVISLLRSNNTLKCPYCPREFTQSECKPLYL